MNKRPCECGCRFKDHKEVKISGGMPITLYCEECPKSGMWCYNYRPCENLKYLEWLDEQK